MVELRPKGITKAHLRASNIPEDYWECDFSNYLGPPNAKSAAKTYLKQLASMKESGTGILFGGPPGPGKTTIAAIVMKYLARAGWSVWMTSLGEIVENIQRGWDKDADEVHSQFIEKCRTVDFLLIDDLGKEHSGATGFSGTIFDNLVRYRVQHRLPTFLTTNLNRTGIRQRYGDALISLVEGKCAVIAVNAADVREVYLKPEVEERFNAGG
jgi:DNA replication protein DnaC